MRRLLSLREGIRRNPLVAVEFIISVFTLLGGIYVLSPLLEISIKIAGASPVIQVIASQTGIFILGLVTTAAALVSLYGIFKDKKVWRGVGLFTNGLVRLYVVLATWLITGLFPLSWLSNAIVMTLCFYLWWRTKGGEG